MAARLGSLALLVVSVAISCELGSFVVLHYIIGIWWMPEYARAQSPQGPGWLTEREAWGAWHAPDRNDWQESRCFSVSLHSNSYGARDRERTVDSDPNRTVVLGDSFAEGWGVEANQRLSDLLEARYHREFLNFGAENDAGPLQYQILYERLASKFSHDQVLILFLPDNDFIDNDADYWRRFRPDFPERYRPYYQAAEPDEGYRAFYPVPPPPDGFADWHSVPPAGGGAWAADWPRRNLWSLAMYRYLGVQFYRMGTYSGYLDYSADQLKAVLWSFAKIKALAGDRRTTIAVIPRPNDFARVRAAGNNRLIDALDRFGREHHIDIVDLLQWMPTIDPRTDQYYLPCDGHWSAAGNRIAADALAEAMRLGSPQP
jgi:lysophospholipase L1-like esterase